MKLTSVIAWLIAATHHSVLCDGSGRIYCEDTDYGKYDQPPTEETGRVRINSGIATSERQYHNVTETPECPELYQRYSTGHTYCKETTSCDILDQGVTEEDKLIILDLHNSLRSKLATGNETRYRDMPSAANMMELEWDDELARVAQAQANLCYYKHDKDEDRAVESFTVGQNLMLMLNEYQKNWNATANWYKSEACFFLPEYIDPFRLVDNYGHFSQIIWAETWKIGCGYTLEIYHRRRFAYYTCNYGPSGNHPPKKAYIVGEPCSQCPENTECSEKYPGLCKSKTEDGPQMGRPSPDDFIIYCDFDGNTEGCRDLEVSASSNFTTRHIYSGNYKTIVLEEGESVTIRLGQFAIRGTYCPFIFARFGPNNATDSTSYTLQYLLRYYEFPVYKHMKAFIFEPVGFQINYGRRTEHIFKFKVNEGAAPHFFDIRAWGISKDYCRLFSENL